MAKRKVTEPEFVENLLRQLGSDNAAARLERYSTYTGAHFESFGDHSRPNEITSDDILAVTMLSMTVGPGRKENARGNVPKGITPRRILAVVDRSHEISGLLSRLTAAPALGETTDDQFRDLFGKGEQGSPEGPVRRLFTLLADDIGFGAVAAHKLIARKRPHLVPVGDSRTEEALGTPDSWWSAWRTAMRDNRVSAALAAVRNKPGAEGHSDLRLADIIVWMEKEPENGNGQ